MYKIKQKIGFTLVEVSIAVVIILILAVLAVPGMLRNRIQANESMTIKNLKTIHTMMEMYKLSNGEYTSSDWEVDMYTNANPVYGSRKLNPSVSPPSPQLGCPPFTPCFSQPPLHYLLWMDMILG